MTRNLLRRRTPGEEVAAELKAAQTSSRKNISPDDLPFDLTAELGEVLHAELKSPGVYFLNVGGKLEQTEVYVATEDAPAISGKARSYGKELAGHPGPRVYELYQEGSGWHIIDFEVLRYQLKSHLPIEEGGDSLFTIALYGMEEHPDYFGAFPVPAYTPRGCTVRHRTLLNGVYWLETDRCEEMLAVCYPIWDGDITIPEQNLAERLAYDWLQGIDNTLGYLFFPKHSSCIPLYELCKLHPQIGESGLIDMAALMNAILQSYPEYAAAHNEEEAKYERGSFIRETPEAGTEFLTF